MTISASQEGFSHGWGSDLKPTLWKLFCQVLQMFFMMIVTSWNCLGLAHETDYLMHFESVNSTDKEYLNVWQPLYKQTHVTFCS